MACQLLNRHWIITDGRGDVQEVKGPGVIGQQPWLGEGEQFSYTSGAVLRPRRHHAGQLSFRTMTMCYSRCPLMCSRFALTVWCINTSGCLRCGRCARLLARAESLMKKVRLKDSDELWLAGDLINRGPDRSRCCASCVSWGADAHRPRQPRSALPGYCIWRPFGWREDTLVICWQLTMLKIWRIGCADRSFALSLRAYHGPRWSAPQWGLKQAQTYAREVEAVIGQSEEEAAAAALSYRDFA